MIPTQDYSFINPSDKRYKQDDVNAVGSSFSQLMDTANRRDVNGHLSFYLKSPDLIFVLNTDVIQGWDILREKQSLWWKNGLIDVQYAWKDLRIVYISDIVMSTIANLSSEWTSENGEKGHDAFAFTAVWLKGEKGWRIVNAHETMLINPS
jgi:ketosteroid isomerase-like protein